MNTESRSSDESFRVEYAQFSDRPLLRAARTVAGALTWPVVWPLAMLCRQSDLLFRTASEAVAFYRFALPKCGTSVVIEFGTILLHRDVTIGDYVLVGERCTFLSGATYHYHDRTDHYHDRTDVPMALQSGELRRIRIGRDCWIGSNATELTDGGEARSSVPRPL